jgi:hypothetical protein
MRMEVTTDTKERAGKRSHGGVIALGVVLLAILLAGAYYQQELSTYWRLRGWDTGAVRQTVERFIQEAHAGQLSAGDLLDPAWAKPEIEDGRFVGVTQSAGSTTGALGPYLTRVETFAPEPTIKDFGVRIKNRSGVFQADVQYPNGQWANFDVDRVEGALRIRSVPDALSPTRPPRQPWD